MTKIKTEKWSTEMTVLARLADERANLEIKVVCQVRRVCAEGGTWGNVGAALGCSAQAAWSRYGPQGTMTEQARSGTQGQLGFKTLMEQSSEQFKANRQDDGDADTG